MKDLIRIFALIAYGFELARAIDCHSTVVYVAVLLVGGIVSGCIFAALAPRKTA